MLIYSFFLLLPIKQSASLTFLKLRTIYQVIKNGFGSFYPLVMVETFVVDMT